MIYLTRSHTESHRGTPRALPPQGKFYELYEADADVGNKELGLKISDRVNMKMAGVPEKTFVEYAGKLIGLGCVYEPDVACFVPGTHARARTPCLHLPCGTPATWLPRQTAVRFLSHLTKQKTSWQAQP